METPNVDDDAAGAQDDRNGHSLVSRRGAGYHRGRAGLLACHPVAGGWDKCAGRQRLGGSAGSDEWTRRFLVRRSSRKVTEMQAAPLVTLAFQHPSGDRYIALGGRATIIDDVAEMRTMWSSELDRHFPPGFADANMIVIQVDADRKSVV